MVALEQAGYTIMEKTADLTDVQKAVIDTLHKEVQGLLQVMIMANASGNIFENYTKLEESNSVKYRISQVLIN
ncbi:unnamed protein product [Ranitomeya imitator]|uniref:Uncharacterized protein n=1 Tax=Ranitomeya imitator TaxID=111125 RepID=A0ABN9MPF3_9NEOB|nr:unnamed protein product [Ranitomeya imitator]